MDENRRYEVALSLIPGLNINIVQILLERIGSVKDIFSDKHLSLIEELNKETKSEILNKKYLENADKEIESCIMHNIKILFMEEPEFPQRLLECPDAPLLLYCKGNSDLNTKRIISIVGTRKATEQGKLQTEKLVKQLSLFLPELIVVSGLAYGIDITAHRSAIENRLNTVAVLAHGFQEIYPPKHRSTAIDILNNGTLITEFPLGTPTLKYHFLKRNRIIAGLSDACIIVESAKQGGSMKTGEYANSYNRDVFAFPGRPTDKWSNGCNALIKGNKAIMAESAEDILKNMNWDLTVSQKDLQLSLFPKISENQQKLYNLIPTGEQKNLGDITEESNLSISDVLSDLMQMEILGLIKALPGGYYLKKE